jgi:hypothetical protein
MEKLGTKAVIIIQQDEFTPAGRKAILEIQKLMKLECFSEKDLLVNITKHVLILFG